MDILAKREGYPLPLLSCPCWPQDAVSAALGECEGLTEAAFSEGLLQERRPKTQKSLGFSAIPTVRPDPSDSARPCRDLTTSLEPPASLGSDCFTCLCWCSSSHLWIGYPQVLGFVLPNPQAWMVPREVPHVDDGS